MKRILFVTMIVMGASAVAFGQYKAGSTEQTLIDMDKAWTASEGKGDKKAASMYVADDYMGTMPNGSVENKTQYLDSLKATPDDKDMADDYSVRVFGDTAIMTHRGTVTGKNPLVYRSTHVWMKRNGKWQIVAHHSSEVPKAKGSAMKLSSD
jgi:ketosteroid isomerase-like protein